MTASPELRGNKADTSDLLDLLLPSPFVQTHVMMQLDDSE